MALDVAGVPSSSTMISPRGAVAEMTGTLPDEGTFTAAVPLSEPARAEPPPAEAAEVTPLSLVPAPVLVTESPSLIGFPTSVLEMGLAPVSPEGSSSTITLVSRVVLRSHFLPFSIFIMTLSPSLRILPSRSFCPRIPLSLIRCPLLRRRLPTNCRVSKPCSIGRWTL